MHSNPGMNTGVTYVVRFNTRCLEMGITCEFIFKHGLIFHSKNIV